MLYLYFLDNPHIIIIMAAMIGRTENIYVVLKQTKGDLLGTACFNNICDWARCLPCPVLKPWKVRRWSLSLRGGLERS
jgi:hypothetical protein